MNSSLDRALGPRWALSISSGGQDTWVPISVGADPECLAPESRSNESVLVELQRVRERHYLMPFSDLVSLPISYIVRLRNAIKYPSLSRGEWNLTLSLSYVLFWYLMYLKKIYILINI